jgi:branched-chain amino acid transport system ATP-binding protein
VLTVRSLRVEYNGLAALHGVDLDVQRGEHVAIVGPNGAGKTSLLKTLSGVVEVAAGSLSLDGVDFAKWPGHKRVEAGIVHVPEGRQVFGSMTVRDNLLLGSYRKASRRRAEERTALVHDLFPILADFSERLAATLSGGQQQMLAIGRGLMACPELLLLDEPSMGLSPIAADEVFDGIARMREIDDMAVLLVEQRAHEAFEQCDRAYVLESGEVVLSGTTAELLEDTGLAAAYIGAEV